MIVSEPTQLASMVLTKFYQKISKFSGKEDRPAEIFRLD